MDALLKLVSIYLVGRACETVATVVDPIGSSAREALTDARLAAFIDPAGVEAEAALTDERLAAFLGETT